MKNDISCFTVQIFTQGEKVRFIGCEDVEEEDDQNMYSSPYKCSFESFVEYFDSLTVDGDVLELCNEQFVPS